MANDGLFSFLTDFLGNETTQQAYSENPIGYLEQHNLTDITAVDVQTEMNRVLQAQQGAATQANQGGAANFAGSGVVNLPPPPQHAAYAAAPDGGGLSGAMESISHYNTVYNETFQSFEDNDTTTVNDQDTIIDNSVNQDITAFGDVTQDFDNDVVTGDGAIAAGDNSQNNTGDGAVQAGGNIEDSQVITGSVGGSAINGDVNDSVVGNNNQAVVTDGGDVGAVSFGDGDATNVEAENAIVDSPGGTIVDDVTSYGDDSPISINTGSGDQNVVSNSNLDESVVGSGSVESNDVDIYADDGSAVSYGAGAEASASDTDVTIEGDNYGNVQAAGNEAEQTATVDNSTEYSDSFNTNYQDAFNTDQSIDVSQSENVNANQVDDSVDTDTYQENVDEVLEP